jgi:3-carboxy-cis,cis-muconate cycloisomerase
VSGFDALLVPRALADAVADDAWLAAMLDAERALAAAEAAAGVVPAAAASAIADRCRPELYDTGRLAEDGRRAGNPVEPLVRELRAAVGGDAAGYVHFGATSQDIMDSAAMLVARGALRLVEERLGAAAAAAAPLAETHRTTPMAARTLLQQAVPTSFGAKAAGWLIALLDALDRLAALLETRLCAQLAGAGGTLAALGAEAGAVAGLYAGELGLPEPDAPWHTDRSRVAELAAALAIAAGACEKIAGDVILLAQTEVAEVAEAVAGRSSTMPNKRNPAGSVVASACCRRARGAAELLLRCMDQEHERAAGAWQAEWGALSQALAFTGAAAEALAGSLGGLQVDTARMRANMDAGGGLVMAERISFLIAPEHGLETAHEIVAAAAGRAAAGGSFRDELLADDRLGLAAADLDRALDPSGYLGQAPEQVDRALARYRGRAGA